MTNLPKPLFTALLLCAMITSWCQETWMHEGRYNLNNDSLVQVIRDNASNELSQLEDATDYYKPFVKAARDEVLKRLEEGHYVQNDSLEDRLQRIFRVLCTANQFEFTSVLLINDHPNINAGVNVIGIFEFSIGMMVQVKNDDELAMVVAHELAHHMNYHAADVIYDFYNLEVGEIHRKEFARILQGRGTLKGLKAMQSASYELRKNRRERELIADSLAVVYLQAAGFSAEAGVRILPRLGYHYLDDAPAGNQLIYTLFSPKYPPRNYWLSPRLPAYDREPLGLYHRDSIATHPDLEERLVQMDHMLGSSEASGAGNDMTHVTLQGYREIVKGAYSSRNYEACLYLALLAHREYPEDPLFTAIIAHVFLHLDQSRYDSNPESNIYMFLDYYTMNLSENLKEVNAFLHNLKGEELLEVGYHFLNNPATFDPACEEHYWLLYHYAELTHREGIATQIKTMYESRFPEGLYKF